MKNLHCAILGAGLAATVSVWAQTTAPGASNASPKVPVDPGAVIVPPKTDPEATKKPPEGIDPGIMNSTGKVDKKQQREAAKKAGRKTRPAKVP